MNKVDDVIIIGGGKVGRALFRALKGQLKSVSLWPFRKRIPKRKIDADLVILAIRDRELQNAISLLQPRIGHRSASVVHCAGALGASVLAPLRSRKISVAQMHPMISFASPKFFPTLERGNLRVSGDPAAVYRARQIGKLLKMRVRTLPNVDPVLYHASAALVANGAVALCAAGVALLRCAGVKDKMATQMLGPLLRSVADNVEKLGLPDALTGPVRRGDVVGIEKHVNIVHKNVPEARQLYIDLIRMQLPLARALQEAPTEGLEAIEKLGK